MAKPDQTTKQFVDSLFTFEGGVNTYPSPLLLAKNQLASGLNTTVRKDFVTQRSVLRKITLDSTSQSLLNGAFSGGVYQGGCYFQPDSGPEGIACAIAGRLFQIFPNDDQRTATAREITGFSAATTPQTNDQAWLWQAELWVIWQDGINNPVILNTNAGTAARSAYGTLAKFLTNTTAAFTAPSPGQTTTTAGGIPVTSTANMNVGDVVYFLNFGNMVIAQVVDGTHAQFTNVNVRGGNQIPNTAQLTWQHVSALGLPPGRMGEYGEGRNWFSLVDGRQFVASDIVGGSSGTQAFNYRDAILNITENGFLAGGGNFIVPGAGQRITAFRFTATLDSSLGQGPLEVFTENTVFSCQAPFDRLTWQDVTNPILTESLINNGAMGHNSTINVNGDLTFRSVDGFRSLILARRDIDVWGNVPISREVQSLLDSDNQTLLNWGSSIVFDNRLLNTATPVRLDQGVVHQAIIPINLDPLSSLRGKQPSVYDSERWTALNVFQLFVGSFATVTRAFALSWNTVTGDFELYEILRTSDTTYLDNDITRIVWSFSTASMFRESERVYKQLIDGEFYIDQLEGQFDYQVWYKPDQYPCYVPWFGGSECQTQPTSGTKPGFRPRLGLGEPSMTPCDPVNNRPLREGYTFQFKFIMTGKARFLGARFKAAQADEPEFSSPQCVNNICQT